MIRNLFYQICPIAHNDEWKTNVDQLRRYFDVFNGTLVFIIKTGYLMVDSDDVVAYLDAPEGSQILFEENDVKLIEAKGFFKGLKLLESQNKDEITFYAHTKGITPDYLEEDRQNIRYWNAFMYDFNLGYIEQVEAALQRYSSCGCFKLVRNYDNIEAPWHYSGSFYWFRHDKIFIRPDLQGSIQLERYLSETFLGYFIEEPDAFCIAGENCKNLYKLTPKEWDKMREDAHKHVKHYHHH
jgi:hypothetical protein